jgi:small-conductance mechanosensitive channel
MTVGSPRSVPPAPADIGGVDAFREAVSRESGTIGSLINQLDAWGFTAGDTRFSVWSIMVVLFVVIGVVIFARVLGKLAKRVLARVTSLDSSQKLLIEKILSIVVWAFAIMVGIDLLAVDLTALAVFSGAFGLAIGFGLQKTFGNLIAGIILLMDKSIKPGDVIAIADQAGNETFGQIRRIGIRAVSIITRDEREYLIPNENLMINQVENWSYSSRRVRIQVQVGVAYSSDMDLVQRLFLEAASKVPRVLADPAPSVWLKGFGENSVDFTVHCWIVDPEMGVGNVRSDVLKNLWDLFKVNKVEIPFPQRDVNLRATVELQQLVAALSQRAETRSD